MNELKIFLFRKKDAIWDGVAVVAKTEEDAKKFLHDKMSDEDVNMVKCGIMEIKEGVMI